MPETPKFNFRIPRKIMQELILRVDKRIKAGDEKVSMTKYILEALEEKFKREDKKSLL